MMKEAKRMRKKGEDEVRFEGKTKSFKETVSTPSPSMFAK